MAEQLTRRAEDYYFDKIDELDESPLGAPSDPDEARERRQAISHGRDKGRFIGHPILLHDSEWGVVIPPEEGGDEVVEGERLEVQNVAWNGKTWPVTANPIFVEDGYAICRDERQKRRSAKSRRR